MFELVRDMVALMDPYTVRQACLAMEKMDLSALVPEISRPLLMTHGALDIICPARMAPSGLGAHQMAELNPQISVHEFPGIGARGYGRVSRRRCACGQRVLRADARCGASNSVLSHRRPRVERLVLGSLARDRRGVHAGQKPMPGIDEHLQAGDVSSLIGDQPADSVGDC